MARKKTGRLDGKRPQNDTLAREDSREAYPGSLSFEFADELSADASPDARGMAGMARERYNAARDRNPRDRVGKSAREKNRKRAAEKSERRAREFPSVTNPKQSHIQDGNLSPYPVPTVAEANANIEKIMKQYPKLTKNEAVLLAVYRGTAGHSTLIQNSDGGGAYARYLKKIDVPF